MTVHELALSVVVAAPLLGSVLVPLVSRGTSESTRNRYSLACVLLAALAACALLPLVADGGVLDLTVAGFTLFHADRLALFMALVSLSVGAIIVLYSFDYIAHYEHRDEYFFMVVLFLGAMMGLVFSANLLFIYFFWEITAFVCWRLIGFYREPDCVARADKAFLITVFGALAMLLGFIGLSEWAGSFDLGAIGAAARAGAPPAWSVFLILLGILSKSATLPLHTWLPDAGVAPSPVTALLHAAVLVKIGVYVYARLFVATMDPGPVWHTVVPLVAGVSAFTSAGAALVETNIKRIIAYSTVSQLGFILLGLSAGGPLAAGGGMLYILMHGIAKAGLFLCAGIVEQTTHEKDITKLGGLAATQPVTAVAFLLCSLSVMGIPPFGGFFSKYMVMTGTVHAGHGYLALLFLAGACLTIIYLLRAFTMVFLGETHLKTHGARHELPAEGGPLMVYSVAALGALALLSGFLVHYPQSFVHEMVKTLPGVGL